jgi:AbrB family looped-hinge helix DNA binding protein
MKTGMFLAEIDPSGRIAIPVEIRDRLSLIEGDKVEISLKKIRSKRLEVIIRKNPLHRLLLLPELKEPTTKYD